MLLQDAKAAIRLPPAIMPAITPDAMPVARSIVIEGWRGINHSFALVSQYQILELLEMPDLVLFGRDMPFALRHWNRATNHSGFSPEQTARIDSLADPGETPVDCVFRVCSPFRASPPDDRRRTITFMITEFGLSDSSFEHGAAHSDFFTREDNQIVTSTNWSRDRIVGYGFPAAKVTVIPLGVDRLEFHPLGDGEREATRAGLGFAADETVFLNVGAAIWNKGIDLLLAAFARLRHQGHKVRLILKDQRDVYGVPVEQAIQSIIATCPEIRAPEVIASITLIPGNVSRAQLRTLYGIADAYVSPYRAEGFNLPVLEAIACATPVIVTAGGATDDFCTDHLGTRIAGVLHDQSENGPGCFIEPDPQALLDAMRAFASGHRPDPAAFAAARADVLEQFTWKRAADALADILRAGSAPAASWNKPPAAASARAPAGPVSQSQILELIALLQPRAMASMGKIRIGCDHDGGYVLPACATECDAVLSIGVGNDVSFDLALAERGIPVMQFDHTVDGPPTAHERFSFHKFGWGVHSQGDLLDFDAIHGRFSVYGAKRPLLKFDIEGFEYEVLATTEPAALRHYEVIACEIHDLSRLQEPEFHARVRSSLERLTADHVPVHLHANNYRGTAIIAGIPVPDVLEITLLRRDLDECKAACPDPIPGPLDRPNHPGLPDIVMRAW